MKGWQSTTVLAVLIILAGTTAYYASRAAFLQKQLALRNTTAAESVSPTPTVTETTPAVDPTSTPTETVSPSPSTTSNPVQITDAQKVTQPAETYTVADGDTLYPVSLKHNMSLERLAEANGLRDPYPLKVGQVLLIPNIDAKKNIFEVAFSSLPDKVTSAQKDVDAGKNSWRKDPAAVAATENYGAFGLSKDYEYRLEAKDDTKGSATVLATTVVDETTKSYQISLTQPGKKGSDGLWVIQRVAPKSS